MKIGLIGCGKQSGKHISGLLSHDDVESICVADLNEQAAQDLAGNYNGQVSVSTIDNIFEDEQVNGIIIATPTPSHYPLCRRAIESGKPFLVEKPLAADLATAQDLLDLSNTKQVPGMVGFIYRFSPVFDQMHTFLKADDRPLGEPSHAFFRIAGRGSHQVWKHKSDKGGGAISEMLVHMIDLAVWYFGRATSIRLLEHDLMRAERKIGGETIECDAEDWAVASLTMENGVKVLMQADMSSPVFKQFCEINGEKGLIEGSIQPQYGLSTTLFSKTDQLDKGFIKHDVSPGNLYIEQSLCFINMIKSGSQPEKCTLNEAVEVMRIQDELCSKLFN